MAYRVVQWATGAMGKAVLRTIIDHPGVELAGVYVYSDAKAGRDAGELAGRPADRGAGHQRRRRDPGPRRRRRRARRADRPVRQPRRGDRSDPCVGQERHHDQRLQPPGLLARGADRTAAVGLRGRRQRPARGRPQPRLHRRADRGRRHRRVRVGRPHPDHRGGRRERGARPGLPVRHARVRRRPGRLRPQRPGLGAVGLAQRHVRGDAGGHRLPPRLHPRQVETEHVLHPATRPTSSCPRASSGRAPSATPTGAGTASPAAAAV